VSERVDVALRVLFDADACTGHGRCYSLAPDVFEPDDAGHCVVKVAIADTPALETQVQTGVANCPEQALRSEPA
jgi:ferredoxin